MNTDYCQAKFVPCFPFLPTEKKSVPDALGYEMMRSNGMPANSRNERLEYWYYWAVVDCKVPLYFMLYLNHDKIGMESEKLADKEKLE